MGGIAGRNFICNFGIYVQQVGMYVCSMYVYMCVCATGTLVRTYVCPVMQHSLATYPITFRRPF